MLSPFTVADLKREVMEHPEWMEILFLSDASKLYSRLTGEPERPLEQGERNELQNLVDLTRVHLRREREESAPQTKAPMGRPPRVVRATKWKVSIREDLALFVDLHLLDPVRKQLAYGTRSALLEEVLLEWARKRGFKS